MLHSLRWSIETVVSSQNMATKDHNHHHSILFPFYFSFYCGVPLFVRLTVTSEIFTDGRCNFVAADNNKTSN